MAGWLLKQAYAELQKGEIRGEQSFMSSDVC